MEVEQMTESVVKSSTEVVVDLNEKRPTRILHVNDDPDFFKIAKQCLETEGTFQIDTATSVDEASQKMKNETYDAIVSDYQMPRKDGLKFCLANRLNINSP